MKFIYILHYSSNESDCGYSLSYSGFKEEHFPKLSFSLTAKSLRKNTSRLIKCFHWSKNDTKFLYKYKPKYYSAEVYNDPRNNITINNGKIGEESESTRKLNGDERITQVTELLRVILTHGKLMFDKYDDEDDFQNALGIIPLKICNIENLASFFLNDFVGSVNSAMGMK